MKPRVAILFMMLYGLALLRPAFPLVDYYVKLNEYKRACINQSKPELLCNGQCVLMKRLQTLNVVGANEPAAPLPVKINFEDYPLGFVEPIVWVTRDFNRTVFLFEYIVPGTVSAGHLLDIFHPPL